MKIAAIFIIILILMAGCSANTVSMEEYNELKSELENANENIVYLNSNIDGIVSELDEISQAVFDLTIISDTANLSVKGSGFTITETDYGKLFLSLENVEPYLNGYSIELRIGNPNYMDFIDLDLNVTCFCPNVSSDVEYPEGITVHTGVDVGKFKIEDKILAGSWNIVTIIIPDLGDAPSSLSIKVEPHTVSMTTNR